MVDSLQARHGLTEAGSDLLLERNEVEWGIGHGMLERGSKCIELHLRITL